MATGSATIEAIPTSGRSRRFLRDLRVTSPGRMTSAALVVVRRAWSDEPAPSEGDRCFARLGTTVGSRGRAAPKRRRAASCGWRGAFGGKTGRQRRRGGAHGARQAVRSRRAEEAGAVATGTAGSRRAAGEGRSRTARGVAREVRHRSRQAGREGCEGRPFPAVAAHSVERSRILVRARSSLWLIPVLCVLAGTGIASGTLALDRHWGYEALPRRLVGSPGAANAVLSTIAVAMVSLATLVLTITMVVVQLARGQFSPRIVQRILRDKPSQFAIGLFVATFVHALLTLRAVTDNGSGGGHVPGIALYAAFVLVLASIAVLVIYVEHIGQALRVSTLIELVGKETRKVIDH